jgi:heterodisulfide reductase subunit A
MNDTLRADTLVVGAGIAGLQTALDLAEQGFSVIVVERQPSIGGAMIGLSKVFPTLDCASCITTPKMAAAFHHPNIRLLTYTEVLGIERTGAGWTARVRSKPKYVIEDRCIGCRRCEYVCRVETADAFDGGFISHRAIAIPFSNAIPQVPVLDPERCILCGDCAIECPTDAIDFEQAPREFPIEARAVVVTTGFSLTPLGQKRQYRGDELANVISPLQMERLLAPHGPYGRVLRPSDGKVPDSIAYVQCAGSRDATLGVTGCSRVCCMYAIKQAMLLSGAVPLADITIYYMDIRAFGKGYETFYRRAEAMGIRFVKGKVARIDPADQDDVVLHVENQDEFGRVEEKRHDLVVLSLGMRPGDDPGAWIPLGAAADDGFVRIPDPHLEPCTTATPGVFVAGTACGPKDIVDTIAEAGAAAMRASAWLHTDGGGRQP